MDAGLIIAIVMALLLFLLVVETPVSVALAASGGLGVLLVRGPSVVESLFANTPYTATSSYTLSVIPMYILLGMFALHGKLAQRIYALASRLFRWLPGGLGIATVGACAGFAAVSGSSVATAATIGRISVHEMRQRGYPAGFAAGIVAMAGTLGILIPPSVILVVYGVVTEQSIGALLLAGVIPGILTAVAYMVYVSIRVFVGRRNGTIVEERTDLATELEKLAPMPSATPSTTATTSVGVVEERYTWPKMLRAGFWVLLLFVIILAGSLSGIFTVVESAGIGAFAALIILILETSTDGIKPFGRRLKAALYETAGTTTMTFMILVGASIFGFFLLLMRVPTNFATWVTGLDIPPILVIVVTLLALIPLGMFLDSLSMTIIAAPILAPVVMELGFSGVVYAILFVKLVEIGLVTPPVGMNVYVVGGVTKVPIEKVFLSVLPFLVIEAIVIAVLIAFPQITLWLPDLVRGISG